jgi:hypothetical protein
LEESGKYTSSIQDGDLGAAAVAASRIRQVKPMLIPELTDIGLRK